MNKNIGSVTGKLLQAKSGEKIDSTGHIVFKNRIAANRGLNQVNIDQFKPGIVFGACAAAALYRREMLEDIKVGDDYFDNDYFAYFEDVDLDWRANLKGWVSYYINTGRAYHVREPMTEYSTRFFYSQKNRYFTILKNDNLLSLLKVLITVIPGDLFNIRYDLSLSLKSLKIFYKNYFKMLSKRKYIQKNKKISRRIMETKFLKIF